jgi:hypothetical protein
VMSPCAPEPSLPALQFKGQPMNDNPRASHCCCCGELGTHKELHIRQSLDEPEWICTDCHATVRTREKQMAEHFPDTCADLA